MKKSALALSMIMFLICSAFAENSYKNSSFILDFSFGWNFYSPSDHVKSAYTQGPTPYSMPRTDRGKYGGPGFNIRGLFKLGRTPLKAGFALGGYLFRHATKGSDLVWVDTGDEVGGVIDLVGFHLLAVADLTLVSTDKLAIHLESGLGPLFINESMSKPPFEPALDFIAVGSINLSIAVAERWAVGPQLGFMKGFSKNNIFGVILGFGITGIL